MILLPFYWQKLKVDYSILPEFVLDVGTGSLNVTDGHDNQYSQRHIVILDVFIKI